MVSIIFNFLEKFKPNVLQIWRIFFILKKKKVQLSFFKSQY
jgi:hypothetical protein